VWLVLSHLLNPIIWPKELPVKSQIQLFRLCMRGWREGQRKGRKKHPADRVAVIRGGGKWVRVLQWCHVHWIPKGAAALAARVHVFIGPLRQNCTHHIAMRNRMGGEAIAAASFGISSANGAAERQKGLCSYGDTKEKAEGNFGWGKRRARPGNICLVSRTTLRSGACRSLVIIVKEGGS
jgi:hypothetical protein